MADQKPFLNLLHFMDFIQYFGVFCTLYISILGVPEHPKFDGLTSKWAAIQIRS